MHSVFNNGFSSYSLNALCSFHHNGFKTTVFALPKDKGQIIKKLNNICPA